MVEAYFGFKKMPFAKNINCEDFFESYDIKEADARLEYIKRYRGIVLVTGEPGSGKTFLLRRFVNQLSMQTFYQCYTPHSTVTPGDLYRQLNTLLNLAQKSRKSDLFMQIQKGILDLYRNQGKVTCLILDECQLMDLKTLQELIMITNFEMDALLPFILILIGQPDFKNTLNRQILEPLKQRILVKYHMSGLSLAETQKYIEKHLSLVGRQDPLFLPCAFEVIYQLSQGLPRKIGTICLTSLNAAITKNKKEISGNDIVAIASEF